MTANEAWAEANLRTLFIEVSRVRELLENRAPARTPGVDAELSLECAPIEPPAAIELVTSGFGLSSFERRVVLLCAGMEIDADFAGLCAAASSPKTPFPTFRLALEVLPGAHFSAVSANAPLRRFPLVDVAGGDDVLGSRLRIDERVLMHLLGVWSVDPRLNGLVEPIRIDEPAAPSHESLVVRLAALWSRTHGESRCPIALLSGVDASSKLAVVAEACRRAGLDLHGARAADLPAAATERELLARLWEREALLGGAVLAVECDDTDGAETLRNATAFVERVGVFTVVLSRDPLPLRKRTAVRLDVERLTPADQRVLWRRLVEPPRTGSEAFTEERVDAALAPVVAHFSPTFSGLRAAAAEVNERLAEDEGASLGRVAWSACRVHARPRLDDLAQRITVRATWADLVLPEDKRRLLGDIAAHVRHAATVYDVWGFGEQSARGLGVTTLFAGASGTGKTMAAEVLAGELDLDLYRIDLSQVVSKYIGETEKMLRRIFDAAEEGGALLLFDEADALFGKRSEVKDSHDRYANLEVSYLLQRMEEYRGLAVLTTNMRHALDHAFLRRLRFIVDFPFPDAVQRAEIWRRVFPSPTPLDTLDVGRLSRLNISGGAIRSIAINAAFLAAEAGQPVNMDHLKYAVRAEFSKLEKPMAGEL